MLLQIRPNDIDDFLGTGINSSTAGRKFDVTADMLLKNLRHQSIHCTARRSNQLKHVGALLLLLQRSLDRLYLASNAAHAFEQLFLVPNRMRDKRIYYTPVYVLAKFCL